MSIFVEFLEFIVYFISIFVGFFLFWNYMYKQGFRNEKIWDFVVIITLTSIIVGKLLFIISSNKLVFVNITYLLSPPYLISGVLIASIFTVSVLSSAYNWSIFRVGDYVALTLAYFITIFKVIPLIFEAISTNELILVKAGFGLVYVVFTVYLFRVIKHQVFSGFVFVVFLIGVSFIEVTHTILVNPSIQFSHLTYFAIIVFAAINFFDRSKEIKKMQGNLPQDFVDKMKQRLESQKAEIEEDIKDIEGDDAFVTDNARINHNSEQAAEAEELEEHYDSESSKGVLFQIKAQINKALGRVKEGKYGVDENTGKPISKERLEANPSATTNVDEQV